MKTASIKHIVQRTVATAAAILAISNAPMSMEKPAREMDERATNSLQKLDDRIDIIQKYLCEETGKIRSIPNMAVANEKPREITDLEIQRANRFDELSKALVSFKVDSKPDVLLCPQYLISKSIGICTLPHIEFNPCTIRYAYSISENNSIFEKGIRDEWDQSEYLGVKTLLRCVTFLTPDEQKLFKNDPKSLVTELSRPDYYLRHLHQLCQSLFIEIAQDWCGSSEVSEQFVVNKILPNLKKLKFENNSKIFQLESKLKILKSTQNKAIGKFELKLAIENELAEKLTNTIQPLEAATQLTDTFSSAFRNCAKERECRFLEKLVLSS